MSKDKATIGQKITKRLAGFAAALENQEEISERFTSRRIKLNLEPQPYGPELVKATRKSLGLSQSLFARFLGVSVKAVSAWEQGKKNPQVIACRFMDEIRRNPTYWKDRLKEIARPTAST